MISKCFTDLLYNADFIGIGQKRIKYTAVTL